MKFCVVGSGSKGNLVYIETDDVRVILDVGISLREAKRRIDVNEIDFSKVDAIIISHEHMDHVSFLRTYLKHTNAVLYINELSFENLPYTVRRNLDNVKVRFIDANKIYKIKDLEIMTLELSHDSSNTFGFIFKNGNSKLGYITDTGFVPVQYIELLKDLDGLIIECNHDVELLMECDRPQYLKQRILSSKGHMSNHICLQVLLSILNEKHKIVLLAHLSQDCNSEEIVKEEVIKEASKKYNTKIKIAYQYEATKIYQI